jgi:hypothetical protein
VYLHHSIGRRKFVTRVLPRGSPLVYAAVAQHHARITGARPMTLPSDPSLLSDDRPLAAEADEITRPAYVLVPDRQSRQRVRAECLARVPDLVADGVQ